MYGYFDKRKSFSISFYLFISFLYFFNLSLPSIGKDKSSWQLNNWQLSNSTNEGREFYINLKNNTNRYRKFDIKVLEKGEQVNPTLNLVADCLTGKFGPSLDNWYEGTGSVHWRGKKSYNTKYINYVCYYPYGLNRLKNYQKYQGKVNDEMPHEKTISLKDTDWNVLLTSKFMTWWVDNNSIIREGDILYFNLSIIDHQPYDPLGKRNFENRLKAETSRDLGGEGNVSGKKINCKDRTIYSQKRVENTKPDPYKEEPLYIYLPIQWNPLNEAYGYPLNEKIASLCNLN